MKKSFLLVLNLILLLSFPLNVFAATAPNQIITGNGNPENTSTDTGDFKIHTGYHDMFFHYTRYLNMKVGDKTKIILYVPEKLYEGTYVYSITNDYPSVVTYSGDGTVEALKSIGYGREIKIYTTVYVEKEDRYQTFTTKIHTYK